MKEMKRLGHIARVTVVMGAVALLSASCAAPTDGEAAGATADEIRVASSFTARGTGYYPDSSALEGGFKDRLGKPLHTLQQHLAGNAPYVAVAMDSTAFKYGTRLRIRELETKYGRSIVIRVVDTGGAFRGKGRSRIDICTASNKESLDPTINGTLHIDVLDESGGGSPLPAGTGSTPPPEPTPATPLPPAPAPGAGSGAACSFDGACNPGNDGAGMICTSGHCVTGCHNDTQCPGSKTCKSGQCG